MKLFHTKNTRQSFFFYLRIFFSVSVRLLETKPIGFSDPSDSLWDNTAPMPYEEASHARERSIVGL